MTYTLTFELPGLPKMANQLLRGHWAAKHAHAKKWKRAVWTQVWHKRPPEPLERARLTLTRVSSSEPDFDGIVSGFKHVIDGLVEAKVLAGDKTKNIEPTYRWEKCPPKQGRVRIRVEAA